MDLGLECECVYETAMFSLFLPLPGQANEAFNPVDALIGELDQGEHGIFIFPSVSSCLLSRLGACPWPLRICKLKFACRGGVTAHHLKRIALIHAKLSLIIEAHGKRRLLGLERTSWKLRREGGG